MLYTIVTYGNVFCSNLLGIVIATIAGAAFSAVEIGNSCLACRVGPIMALTSLTLRKNPNFFMYFINSLCVSSCTLGEVGVGKSRL